MDRLDRWELRSLSLAVGKPWLSMYLPTGGSSPVEPKAPLRLDFLLDVAARELQRRQWQAPDVEQLLAPVDRLLHDPSFWRPPAPAVALFRSPEFFRALRLDVAVPAQALVADHPYLRPLLACLAADHAFHVLVLHPPVWRLFKGNRRGMREVARAEFEALSLDPVAEAVAAHSTSDTAPLVLTAPSSLARLYRAAHQGGPMVAATLDPHPPSPEELHSAAYVLVARHFQEQRRLAADRYYELWHTSRASNSLFPVLEAAAQGRVDTLFAASSLPSPDDENMLSLAAIHTYLNDGTLHVVPPREVPGNGALAAVFRY